MGCDIHMVLEKKHAGKWIGVHDFPYLDMKCMYSYGADVTKLPWIGWNAKVRNYRRFALLAGVRGEGPEAKGVPKDVSDLASMRIEEWNGDGHSHTWWSAKEAARIFELTEYRDEQLADAVAKRLEGEQEDLQAKWFGVDEESSEGDEYRLIIWFDN